MPAGRMHERLRQNYMGVPIVGADLTRQSEGGVTVSMFGTLHAGIGLDTVPAVAPRKRAQSPAERPVAESPPAGPGTGGSAGRRRELRAGVADRDAVGHRRARVLRRRVLRTRAARLQHAETAAGRELRRDGPRRGRRLQGRCRAHGHRDRHGRRRPPRAGETAPPTDRCRRHKRPSMDAQLLPAAHWALPPRRVRRARPGRRAPGLARRLGPLGPAYARYFGGAFWDGRVVVLGEGTPAGARVDGRAWSQRGVGGRPGGARARARRARQDGRARVPARIGRARRGVRRHRGDR